MVRLDVAYIFAIREGPTGVFDLLNRYGQNEGLTYGQVQMWRQRNSVSANWQAPLLYSLHREGHDLVTFFTDDTEMAENAQGPRG